MRKSSVVDPYVFVTRKRLDIAVKVMFFRWLAESEEARFERHKAAIMRGEDIEPDAAPIYREHIIQRTAGNEKRSWKACIQDYVQAANALFFNMKAVGFDPAHPVELGSNLNLMGGAHRIAAAIVLGCDVPVRIKDKSGNAAPWDEKFMCSRWMSPEDMKVILREHERLEHEARRRIG